MRHALVIARRELEEKRFVALAAAGFAALPFLVAMIPSVHGGHKASEVITVTAGLLAIGFTAAVALVLGGSVIGRDLAESRLSFYFSRPVSAASIWFGKVAAALALIAGAFWLIVLPARLAAGPAWFRVWSGGWRNLALTALGGAVVLFFGAHVIGSFVRSRSPWVAVDFAALCVAGVTGGLILRPLIDAGAPEAVTRLAIAVGCGVAVALIGGGAWQLARGRTDRRRSHIALSQFLWTVVGATLALTGGFVAWMVSATPGDLTTINADMSRPGSWAIITGQARGRMDYHPVFTYNVDTGANSRLDRGRLWRANFTPDGKTLLVGRVDSRIGGVELFTRPVQGGSEKATGLTVGRWSGYATTDDGGRIAAVDGGILTVYDVAQKRSLASVRLPDSGADIVAMYFDSPALMRVLTINIRQAAPNPIPRTLRVYELDLTRRALRQTGEFTRDARYVYPSANQDGSRLLLRDRETLYVLDGRTAALQMTLESAGYDGSTWLRDGGVAFARREGGHVIIEIVDHSGARVRRFAIPMASARRVREMRDGRLMLLAQTIDRPETGAWYTLVIDPSTGAIVQRIPGSPVTWRGGVYWGDDFDPRRGPIDLPKVYRDAKGRLIRWNFATQRAEVILPRG